VYAVLGESGASGVSVSVLPATLTAPETPSIVSVVALTLAGAIASDSVTTTALMTETLTDASAGARLITVGGVVSDITVSPLVPVAAASAGRAVGSDVFGAELEFAQTTRNKQQAM